MLLSGEINEFKIEVLVYHRWQYGFPIIATRRWFILLAIPHLLILCHRHYAYILCEYNVWISRWGAIISQRVSVFLFFAWRLSLLRRLCHSTSYSTANIIQWACWSPTTDNGGALTPLHGNYYYYYYSNTLLNIIEGNWRRLCPC